MSQSDDFAKSIAFAWWRFSAIFKMLSFFQYELLFRDVFCIEQLQCVVETFLACFYAFLIFEPKWRFCKVYSLCLVAIFGHFQNAFISPISSCFFEPFFCIEQLQCVVETFLACFYAFLIFEPKWRFCKVYSLCLVAIFGHFQNAFISPISSCFFEAFFAENNCNVL